MRPRISIRGSVRPSVRPSVRNAYFLNARKGVFSTIETARDCAWQREGIGSDERGREGGDKGRGDKEWGERGNNKGDASDGLVLAFPI